MQNQPIRISQYDNIFLFLTLTLVGIGVIFIISASWHESLRYYGTPWIFIVKHLSYLILGVSLIYGFSFVHVQWFKRFAWQILVGIILGLLVVAKYGIVSGGSRRWLDIGPLSLQVSELAKIGVPLIVAKIAQEKKNYLWGLALVGIIILFILKQPDLGTAILVALGGMAALFVSGFNLFFFALIIAVLGLGGVMHVLNTPYQLARVKFWLNPQLDPLGHGYNILQSIKAIASGGLVGQGIGGSLQKLGSLPISYADFIFSIICEEIGLFGGVSLIAIFLLWIFRALEIAMKNQDDFTRTFGFALALILAFQVLINLAVATGLFPITGMTLPLISFGGSSFISSCIICGIILNISRGATQK